MDDKKYVTKYGIQCVPTGEYVSWFDRDTAKLFDIDKATVENVLADIDDENFKLVTVTLPEGFDGSNLINVDNTFISKQVLYSNI